MYKTCTDSPPTIITIIANTFSLLVLGAIFPKPTLVKLLRVKYKEVIYLVLRLGPLVGFDWLIGLLISPARYESHPLSSRASTIPIACHTQASQ